MYQGGGPPPPYPPQQGPPPAAGYAPHPQMRPNQDMELLVPINVAPLALIAGYVGFASMFCFPAPIALVLGVVALRSLAKNPQQTGKGRAWLAIVTGGLGTAPSSRSPTPTYRSFHEQCLRHSALRKLILTASWRSHLGASRSEEDEVESSGRRDRDGRRHVRDP
jgi:Domain of unknown function (DUF4190)